MLTWDDAISNCQDLSNDSTSGSLAFFKRMMNVGYKFILSDLSRPVTEKTKTALTVAGQQAYQMGADFLFVKSITVTVGSTVYPVVEEEAQEYWDYLNLTAQSSDYPQVYFVRPSFGYSGAEILFYPKPSTAGNTITIIYEATDKDLSMTKYTDGSVAVTNGSAVVTGTNTSFAAAMVGRFFKITDTNDQGDGMYYKIATFTSATSITLENVYEGSTLTGVTYEIDQAFNLPEDIQILPCYFALQHYYAAKRDIEQEKKYIGLFNAGLSGSKLRHATKSRGEIIRPKGWLSRWGYTYPAYFPQSGISS